MCGDGKEAFRPFTPVPEKEPAKGAQELYDKSPMKKRFSTGTDLQEDSFR